MKQIDVTGLIPLAFGIYMWFKYDREKKVNNGKRHLRKGWKELNYS